MKNVMNRNLRLTDFFFILISFLFVTAGCKKTSDVAAIKAQNNSNAQTSSGYSLGGFTRINLSANKTSYHALHVNPKLLNAWGMSANDEGEIWVSAADGGVSFVYDRIGGQLTPHPVDIPSHKPNLPGNPTGNIYNETTDFIVPGTGKPAEFLFASEDGTISAWNSGSSAILVADRSSKDASYKGIAIANDNGLNFLYLTNFSKHKIDVFDKDFNHVTGKPFYDGNIPAGYTPFGIREINNMLYVTYARQTKDGEEDSSGTGLGFVDVYWPNGTLSKHFAAHGTLNAPWGIAEAQPALLGKSAVLIGNFGDGHINIFDWDGNFKGQLMQTNGEPVWIEGLWAIDNGIKNTSAAKQLYFTAGPNEESDGVFGFLGKR